MGGTQTEEDRSAMEQTAVQQKWDAKADLDQDAGKKQRGKGPVGSLENPEIYENVPGHVLPSLESEFDDFDTEFDRYRKRYCKFKT